LLTGELDAEKDIWAKEVRCYRVHLYSMTYHLGYQIKQDEMQETCSMHVREEFLWGNPKEQDYLDDMGVKFLNKEDGIAWTRVI